MTIQIGIVGCGGHANTHGATIAESPFATLVACADIDPERARLFAETHGAPYSYGSLEEMAQNHSLDLLIIVAFPTVHPPLIKEAVGYGIKTILCEKPVALNAGQVQEIIEVAKQTGTTVVEGLMYRSHPQIRQARKLIGNGTIGDVRYIHAQFSDYRNLNPGNWRNDSKLGGGSMTAKGCYLVDACNLFSGARAAAAFCIESNDSDYGGVEIGETGTILYENGVTAQFETNHRSCWREEIKVCGTLGTLVIPHAIVTKSQTRTIEVQLEGSYERRPMQIEAHSFDVHNSYALQLENIYRCIREGASLNMPLEHSLANYKVTDALMKSVHSGKLEKVEWRE
ncbi:Gfo/Idh/MocA family protein [Paenibacillus piri]|uniref:Gfo/Idh/MocA family oxidoreductase n=1 Tax=Paenibacillus piri TaxID=2547395 RepID=A0A4R5KD18_9BACL|nr:Gfo/Idh/MocA family oxidoreductase [Paenibacillus piri]TDF91980.1 Gfo/Idh/MocA family oxidoreductase [Paenibacillus piri]